MYRQPRPIPLLTPNIGAAGPQTQHGLLIAKLFYIFFFSAIGCMAPFLNVHFARQGLSGIEIGWLSSIAPLVALIANPTWGAIADRWQIHRYILAFCTLMAGLVSLLFLWIGSFWAILIVVITFSFFRTPIGSLLDSTVIDLVRRIGAHYGRQRMWGSAGFVTVVYVLGRLLTLEDLRVAFWLHAALLSGGCFLLSFFFPIAGRRGAIGLRAGLRQLASSRSYMSLLGAMALLGVGMSSYVNFMSLHMLALGGDENSIGVTWALNALAEVPIMYLGTRWFARFHYSRIISFGFTGLVLVWFLMSLAQNPVQFAAVSFLNGICYGALWVAAVNFAAELAPPGLSATAQALIGAAQAGIGWSLGAVISGYIWEAMDGHSVFLAASIAAVLAVFLLWTGNRSLAPKLKDTDPASS